MMVNDKLIISSLTIAYEWGAKSNMTTHLQPNAKTAVMLGKNQTENSN